MEKKNRLMGPEGVPDTKTDRPTGRRSQHQLTKELRESPETTVEQYEVGVR
jgi:hypothetical protein